MLYWRHLKKYLKSQHVFRRIFYSFYFRLILLDIKKNLFFIILWLLLFGMITNNIAPSYGLAYLFLGPEYFGEITWLSYFLTGFACGGFNMSYNIASYIKNAFRFPFLATLRYPFTKYCLNNFFFPLLFVIVYSWKIALFLKQEELMKWSEIGVMLLAFLFGTGFFIITVISYFFKANKNITKLFGIEITDTSKDMIDVPKGERNPHLTKESRDWYVETYLIAPLKARRVRSVKFYKKETLNAVLIQNHRAAFIFQMISIISLVALGIAPNTSLFIMPTSVSFLLLFTVVVMLFSSLYAWFRGWTTLIFIIGVLAWNYLHKVNFSLMENHAYGLVYKTPTVYDYAALNNMDKDEGLLKQDIANTLSILTSWKAKNTSEEEPLKKPKLILINTSGGGLRSSLWTFYALKYVDSLVNGKLLKQTQLITGSSGGMVGAAYLRELYLRKQQKEISTYYSKEYYTNISKDILNPIAFSIVTNEWVFPLKSFKVDDETYPQDRAYAFEQTLQENVGHVLDKRLGDYYLPEYNSQIPMMVFSPSIVNDGRKLLISPQGISYLTQNAVTKSVTYKPLIDGIEYSRFFKKQSANRTLFTSVIRMSATFPYIMPMVSLPSTPRIEMIDAGMRDNYGLETSIGFIKTFNDWIAENTSGIVIIQVRDKYKQSPIDDNPPLTLFETFNQPMGSLYGNLFSVQDYNQNSRLQLMDVWCKSPVEIIDLQLRNNRKERISLSWHLTNKEKKQVLGSIDLIENQQAIKRIIQVINN